MNPSSTFSFVLLFTVTICFAGTAYPKPTENPSPKRSDDPAEIALTMPNDSIILSPEKKIKRIAIRYLKKQQKENKRLLSKQRKQVQHLSEELEAAIADAIAKKIFSNRALIIGSDERAIGEGMSNHIKITREPAPDYPYYNVPRTHKNLYDADVQLEQTKAREETMKYCLDNTTTLVAAIQRQAIASTPFKKDQIHQQIDNLTQEQL